MNITPHKMPMILSTLVLVMGLLYACPDADSGGSTPTLKAGDITYDKDSIAQGTAGTATPKSSTITDFSTMKFSLKSISTHTGTQTPPSIAEDGTITTTTQTSAGSYRVTITPDGSIFTGTLTVDFYVTIKAANIKDLDTKLKQAITDYGRTGDFNYIDTSEVTTMSYLFKFRYTPGTASPEADSTRTYIASFNGDISKWDVSSVTDFSYMFWEATVFNQDIGEWIVKKGTDFGHMFWQASVFNQDIGGWDVSAGKNFDSMFSNATAFNQDIGRWNVSAGEDFNFMFSEAVAFNQNIGDWTVTAGKNFSSMFDGARAFNQDISEWTVTAGTDFSKMFRRATAFTQDVSSWNLDPERVNITDMFLNSGVTNPPDWYPQQ